MMRKKACALVSMIMVSSLLMVGCAKGGGLENKWISISKYKGVEVAKIEKTKVSDESVEARIQQALSSNKKEEVITGRGVKKGDVAVIDFVGKINGVEFQGGSAEGFSLEIGSNTFIEGFEDSVIGHKTGETFDWNGKFPENYAPEYAGKDVVFTITVKEIKHYKTPKLTDKFVKKVSSESKTVKEYKKEIKATLEKEAEELYNGLLMQEVNEAVLKNTKVKSYPKKELEEMVASFTDYYKQIAEAAGSDYKTYITEQTGMSIEAFEAEAKKNAEQSLKAKLITEAIADKEKLHVEGKEFDKKLDEFAKLAGYESGKDLKGMMDEDTLKTAVESWIVRQWLADHCVQVEKKK